jgi:hypothetical protein
MSFPIMNLYKFFMSKEVYCVIGIFTPNHINFLGRQKISHLNRLFPFFSTFLPLARIF